MPVNTGTQHFHLKPRQMYSSGSHQQKRLQSPAGLSHICNRDYQPHCSANKAAFYIDPNSPQEKKKQPRSLKKKSVKLAWQSLLKQEQLPTA